MVRYAVIGVIWALIYHFTVTIKVTKNYSRSKMIAESVVFIIMNVAAWPITIVMAIIDAFNWLTSTTEQPVEESTDGSSKKQ